MSDHRTPLPRDQYQRYADTIGGVPSLRWMDNLYQGLAILVSVAIFGVVGYLLSGEPAGAFLGGFAGLVAGFLVSGSILMVLGWIRAAHRTQPMEREESSKLQDRSEAIQAQKPH